MSVVVAIPSIMMCGHCGGYLEWLDRLVPPSFEQLGQCNGCRRCYLVPAPRLDVMEITNSDLQSLKPISHTDRRS